MCAPIYICKHTGRVYSLGRISPRTLRCHGKFENLWISMAFFLRPLSLFEPEEGMLFSLRDMDGDGTIFGDEEVSGYDTQARSWGGGLYPEV